MSKHDHRRLVKEKLSLIDDFALMEKSTKLSSHLEKLLCDLHVIQKKLCIGAFAPIEREPLWNTSLSSDYQKLTAFPAFDVLTMQMIFKKAEMSDLMIKEDFGVKIKGPSDGAPKVVPDVILIPGLAFNQKGERLGRGKGFYDKFLENFHGIKIGICFSEQLLLDGLLPIEEHDELVDYIVTEEKIINCKFA